MNGENKFCMIMSAYDNNEGKIYPAYDPWFCGGIDSCLILILTQKVQIAA